MTVGAFPVGSIPVGAGSVFTITPVAIGGRASLNGKGQSSVVSHQAIHARASLDNIGRAIITKVLVSLHGHSSLFGSAHSRLSGHVFLRGRSSLISSSHGRTSTIVQIGGRGLDSGRARTRIFNRVPIIAHSKLSTIVRAHAKLGIAAKILPIFPVLPPLAWSVHKKPIMASRVTTGVSGRDNQLAAAAFPRWAFTLTYGGSSWLRERTQNIVPDLTKGNFTEFEQLSALFIFCLGPAGDFLYEDPDDRSRANAWIAGGNGTTTTFPINLVWGTGPYFTEFTFPVGAINTIDAVYFDGVVQSTASYSLDVDRQKLIFTAPPPANVAITADYHFYYRCRFLDDHLNFLQWAKNLWECKEVRFETVKP